MGLDTEDRILKSVRRLCHDLRGEPAVDIRRETYHGIS